MFMQPKFDEYLRLFDNDNEQHIKGYFLWIQ